MSYSNGRRVLEKPDPEAVVFAVYSGLVSDERYYSLLTSGGRTEMSLVGVMRNREMDESIMWRWYGSRVLGPDTPCSHFGEFTEDFRLPSLVDRMKYAPSDVMQLVRWHIRQLVGSDEINHSYFTTVNFGQIRILPASMLFKDSQFFFLEIVEEGYELGRGLSAWTQGFFHDRTERETGPLFWFGRVEIDNGWRLAYASVHSSGLANIRII